MHSCALDNLSCLSNTVLSAVRSQSRALAPMFSTAPEASLCSTEFEMLNRANLREEEPEFKHRMLRSISGDRILSNSGLFCKRSYEPTLQRSRFLIPTRALKNTRARLTGFRNDTWPGCSSPCFSVSVVSLFPLPITHFGHIFAVFADVLVVLIELSAEELNGLVAFFFHSRHTANGVDRKLKAVHIVEHHHVKGCGGGALFLVAAHVQVVVILPAIREPVNQPRISVVGEDNRFIGGKDAVEVFISESVGMFACRLQDHQIDDVYHSDLQLRHMTAQQRRGGKNLQSGNVAGRSHHDVRIALVVAGPLPDTCARLAVANGGVHIKPLQFRLLAGHDHVDVVAAAQTVIGD